MTADLGKIQIQKDEVGMGVALGVGGMQHHVQAFRTVLRNVDVNVGTEFAEGFFEQTDIARIVLDDEQFDGLLMCWVGLHSVRLRTHHCSAVCVAKRKTCLLAIKLRGEFVDGLSDGRAWREELAEGSGTVNSGV